MCRRTGQTTFRSAQLFLVAILLFLSPPASSVAQSGSRHWLVQGPYGGFVESLVIDPVQPTTLYASAGGIYNSTDGGNSWEPLALQYPFATTHYLALDPVTRTTLYAIIDNGMYKSTDGGMTWNPLNPPDFLATSLVIDPATPSNLYLVGGGLHKSTDGGEHWFPLTISYVGSLQTLVLDPVTPTVLYAGSSGGLYKSTDGGATWNLTGLFASVNALAVVPTQTNILYAGLSCGIPPCASVRKSTDGGITWDPADTGLTATRVLALAIDPATPSTLYAGTSCYFNTTSPCTTVFKSIDGGAHWTPASAGITDGSILDLATSSTQPIAIYARSRSGGVFKSTDGGTSWSSANTGLAGLPIGSMALAPTISPTLYVAPSSFKDPGVAAGDPSTAIFKSTDGGDHWDALFAGWATTVPPTDYVRYVIGALAVDPLTPTTVYASSSCGILKSTDGGNHWNCISTQASFAALAVNPLTPTILYGGADTDGIYRSTNGGMNWDLVTSSCNWITALAIDPLMPTTVYAGGGIESGRGVCKSIDGGLVWNRVLYADVTSLAIDPLTPSTIYASLHIFSGGGILKSTDGGTSWHPINNGLTDIFVLSLAVDPSLPNTIFAGTASHGVFQSLDGGNHWSPMNTDDSLKVYALAVDRTGTTPRLYAGTSRGVWAIDLPVLYHHYLPLLMKNSG